MSDISQNANAYNSSNTARIDVIGQNTGQPVAGQNGVVGFDCSGYYYHVMRESGYDIPRTTAAAYERSSFLQGVDPADVRPGDTVFFEGHVGFVVEFNSATGTGAFRSMTGRNNTGVLRDSPFAVSNQSAVNGGPQYWGVSESSSGNPGTSFVRFGRIDPSRYRPQFDLHRNQRGQHRNTF